MVLTAYRRKLRIWETNFGRDAGWYVERNGERIAILIDPRAVEMFWDSYLLVPLTDNVDLRQRLRMDSFWHRWTDERVVFRNREFGTMARLAFPAMYPLREAGRIVMRGLYLPIGWGRPWDWLIVWWRRRRRS